MDTINNILPTDVLLQYSYLLSAIMFVYGLKLQSNPDNARKGNLWAAAGMIIPMITTLILHKNQSGSGISMFNGTMVVATYSGR